MPLLKGEGVKAFPFTLIYGGIMIQVYSTNITVAANTAIPLNNVAFKKGCTAELNGTSTISLNKCGVYMVSFDASSATSTTVQLFVNGVAQPQAQATGTNPSFVTLVSVGENNTCCPCSAPTVIQFMNTGAEATFTDFNVVVTKVI